MLQFCKVLLTRWRYKSFSLIAFESFNLVLVSLLSGREGESSFEILTSFNGHQHHEN